ncbi:hypothetical protein F5Y10DRAFT_270870 [Nemania abortiva]|nr:hypothetical protein F5Y10DRAFT_270870 [Nemania abortiva]
MEVLVAPDPIEVEEDDSQEDMRIVRSLFDSGVPWFTKATLRRVGEQLDQYAAGTLEENRVLIDGVDGKTVAVPVPEVHDHKRLARGHPLGVNRRPLILYGSIQSMTDKDRIFGHFSRSPYLSLAIAYRYEPTPDGQKDTTLSAAELGQILASCKREWEASPEYTALRASIISNPVLSKARKVVGFSLGPAVYGDNADCGHDHSLFQYALLLSLRELVAENNRTDEVPCFAQDPALCPVATEMLQRAGITVLTDPYAFLEVDDTSIVVSISSNIPVKQIVTEIARPVGILWPPGTVEEEKGKNLTDPTSPRVEAMLENEYVDIGFPKYRPFSRNNFYMRKE